jgi:flagellin
MRRLVLLGKFHAPSSIRQDNHADVVSYADGKNPSLEREKYQAMLSLINNLSALIAQNNLNSANTSLNTSLQRLSSGLRINSGADDPAGLVISQEQMAQISGLQTAITNTSKAVNVVQIADGALNETNALLLQIRGLAVDAANSGTNDNNTLAADQAQITNALDTITRIANSTQFGSEHLLDGTRAATTTSDTNGVTATAGGTIPAGTYYVNIVQQANAASVTNTNAVNNGANAEILTINGVQISIAANSDENTMLGNINAVSNQTGVKAIDGGSGNILLYATTFGSGHTISVSSTAGATSATGLTDTNAINTDGTDLQATITTTPPGSSSSVTSPLLTGTGDVLNVISGPAAGLTITDGPTSSNYQDNVNNPFTGATGSNVAITVNTSNALVFQIGANAGQTASLTIQSTQSNQIGQGVSAVFANLSLIDVTNPNSSSDVLKVVDKAISDISNLAGTLGAFQDNTLQATATNLQAQLQNTTSANSTIRDTNFAQESANFAQGQVLVQAGTQVLKNANQLPQLILTLLQ